MSQVDWDESFDRAHRGVNVGRIRYEEVAIFFLDDDAAEARPRVTAAEQSGS